MMLFRQINLNKSIAAKDHICSLISHDGGNCIYLIQEPYWSKNKTFSGLPPGYKILGTQLSRAIVIAPQHIPLFSVQKMTCKDFTLCLYDDGEKKRYLGSFYLDGTKPWCIETMCNICDFITNSKIAAILCLYKMDTAPYGTVLKEL